MQHQSINIENLVIEVTRRCNLCCDHCLRGDSEDIDIKDGYIYELMTSIDSIGTLTITGGEPSLVPEKIKYILKSAKENNVSISSFYIATNAVKISPDFIMSIMELFLYCDEKDLCKVDISNDVYHEYVVDNYQEHEDNKELLKVLSIAGDKFSSDRHYEPIKEGRGKDNYYKGRDLHLHEYWIEDDSIMETAVYLNVNGGFIAGCNFSYETQDNLNFVQLGYVMNEDFNLIEACEKYNKQLKNFNSTKLEDIKEFCLELCYF